MVKTKKGEITATCTYPPYCIKWIGEKHFMVGGGGGASKTGVPNKFDIYELKTKENGEQMVEKVADHDTDVFPVMNAAVVADGKNYSLAAGLDQYCQLYNLKYKVVTPKKPGEVSEGVRKRKGNATKSEDHQRVHRIVTVDVEEVKRIETDTKDVQKAVAFSPDATLLATGGTDGHLRIWKKADFNKVQDITAHKDIISSVEFSPDGRRIVTISFDKKATVWNVKDGKRVCDLNWERKTERPYRYRACKYFTQIDKKRTRLCTAHIPVQVSKPPPSYLTLWETESYRPQVIKKASNEIICSMAISSDGVYLATGGAEGSVAVYTSFNLCEIYRVGNIHKSVVTDLVFAPQEKSTEEREFTLFSICPDHDIRIFENNARGNEEQNEAMAHWVECFRVFICYIFAALVFGFPMIFIALYMLIIER